MLESLRAVCEKSEACRQADLIEKRSQVDAVCCCQVGFWCHLELEGESKRRP
jgi:hypothetical protein